ncbi:hypothetical protein [Duganella sp.]|uniref:hypothetical protein n=1 Tax=Duganella sp. TaxID=1904440 RepID=UPI0031DC064D
MEEDGGYYAIKGFDFQIDRTIIEIFSGNDEFKRVTIEHIQDLNTDDVVVQVKYKEAADFSNVKIREPVAKLIDSFATDIIDRKYILYCYFKDKKPSKETFSKAKLDKILEIAAAADSSDAHKKLAEKISSIKNKTRAAFAKKFVLQFAEDYDSQFSEVIRLIGAQDFCKSRDEAIFYYGYIADYLRKIVISNTDRTNRTSTRHELVQSIKNGKRKIFHTSFAEFEERSKFIKFITPHVIELHPYQNNVIIIGSGFIGSAQELGLCIGKLIDKYFHKATFDIKPPTIFVEDRLRIDLKKYISGIGIDFKDGYEEISFNLQSFNLEPIVTRKKLGKKATDSLENISFKVKIVSLSRVTEVAASVPLPSRILYLGSREIGEWNSVPAFLIDSVSQQELSNFLRVQK